MHPTNCSYLWPSIQEVIKTLVIVQDYERNGGGRSHAKHQPGKSPHAKWWIFCLRLQFPQMYWGKVVDIQMSTGYTERALSQAHFMHFVCLFSLCFVCGKGKPKKFFVQKFNKWWKAFFFEWYSKGYLLRSVLMECALNSQFGWDSQADD